MIDVYALSEIYKEYYHIIDLHSFVKNRYKHCDVHKGKSSKSVKIQDAEIYFSHFNMSIEIKNFFIFIKKYTSMYEVMGHAMVEAPRSNELLHEILVHNSGILTDEDIDAIAMMIELESRYAKS